MPSFVVSVEAISAAPRRDAEEELLLAFLSFDVLRIALYEASPEGPGSALRPVGVVFSASDFAASASALEFSTSASDVLSSAVKGKVLNELVTGVCPQFGSVGVLDSVAKSGGFDEALALALALLLSFGERELHVFVATAECKSSDGLVVVRCLACDLVHERISGHLIEVGLGGWPWALGEHPLVRSESGT